MRSKRRTTEEQSSQGPRKRVAFGVPTKDTTKAIVERNASSSSFLRLPREIRDQVYREVLGDRFIHLKHLRHTYEPEWSHLHGTLSWNGCGYPTSNKQLFRNGECWLPFVCNKGGPNPEDELRYMEIMDDNRWIWRFANEELLPGTAAWLFDDAAEPEDLYDREMHLGMLRACRQFYNEANPILWATNTFSFETAHCCKQFFDDRNPEQKAAVKSLHLVVNIEHFAGKAWNKALSKSLVRSLKGLADLRLVIKDRMEIGQYRTLRASDALLKQRNFEGVLNLSRLPLQSVDVSMMPYFQTDCGTWTQSDKDEYAELLKRRLLSNH